MALKTQVLIEYLDRNLSGSTTYRDEDIPIFISIESNDNPSLVGTILALKLLYWSQGTQVTITKATTGSGAALALTEITPSKLEGRTVIKATDFTNLPVGYNVNVTYYLEATFTDTSKRSINEGMFTIMLK